MFWFKKDPRKLSGWKKDEFDPRDISHREVFGSIYKTPEELPKIFSRRSKCTKTPYQNGHNCCVLASQAFLQEFNSKQEGKLINLSFRWNYGMTPGETGGRTFRDTAKFLQTVGMPTSSYCENDIKLSKSDFIKVIDLPAIRENASFRRIKNYEFIYPLTYNNIKNALLKSPIQVAAEVRGDWNASTIKWTDKPSGSYHAFVLIGWDDSRNAWEIANQWDPLNNNFTWMDYGYRLEAAITFDDLPDDYHNPKITMLKIIKPKGRKDQFILKDSKIWRIPDEETLLLLVQLEIVTPVMEVDDASLQNYEMMGIFPSVKLMEHARLTLTSIFKDIFEEE